MKKMRGASFSVEFDRSVARARLSGNDRLAEHLEKLRPNLNLGSDDEGEVFASTSLEFAKQLTEVCKELQADPFDTLLILSGTCTHVINRLQRDGIDFGTAIYALCKSLETIAYRMQKFEESQDGG
jgi:hypothetical protein